MTQTSQARLDQLQAVLHQNRIRDFTRHFTGLMQKLPPIIIGPGKHVYQIFPLHILRSFSGYFWFILLSIFKKKKASLAYTNVSGLTAVQIKCFWTNTSPYKDKITKIYEIGYSRSALISEHIAIIGILIANETERFPATIYLYSYKHWLTVLFKISSQQCFHFKRFMRTF